MGDKENNLCNFMWRKQKQQSTNTHTHKHAIQFRKVCAFEMKKMVVGPKNQTNDKTNTKNDVQINKECEKKL